MGGAKIVVAAIINGGNNWFVNALFLAKIVYWVIARIFKHNYIQTAILVALMIIGVFSYSRGIPNVWRWQHALTLVFFLHLGKMLSRKEIKKYWCVASFIVYASVIMYLLCKNMNIPVIVNTFMFGLYEIPVFIVLATTGTLFMLYFSRKINNSVFLEFCGKESLILYLTHLQILYLITPIVFKQNEIMPISTTLGKCLLLFFSSFALSSLVALAVRTRPLRWVKGSF